MNKEIIIKRSSTGKHWMAMSIPPRKWIDWKQWKAIDKAFRQEDNRLLNNK